MHNKFFTYVLYSNIFKRLYIGHTNNLEKRIERHNNGYVTSSKAFRPYKLIYFEEHDSREKAVYRERTLKSLDGRKFVKQFINKD